ncbi:hypothetical protein [Aquimarina pacifica]|uniref:hypothetical protein n=1 Tax=Aquimarina pacifica TaxID=1296415 RepID=UPI000470C072|nr:hypothetical protein [Aquimarina pacifica]
MPEISNFTIIVFIATTFLTVLLFLKASVYKKYFLGILFWMILVGALGLSGFYQETGKIPPRFTLLLGPVFIFMFAVFLNKRSTVFIDNLSLKWLTLLHVIRIPVEIILHDLFVQGLIPEIMTFEGYNFDILSGLTAPILYYFVFINQKIGYKGLLIWNFVCLGLLINIVTIAILSAQTPIQQLAFDQPNVGVTYFPFVWLPAVIVPIVMFAHVSSILRLVTLIKKG